MIKLQKFYILLISTLIYNILKVNAIKTKFLRKTISNKNEEENEIDLNPKDLPSPEDPDIEYIAILHTNDIHGSFYPKKIQLPSSKNYSVGGLEYLSSYIKIMKEKWKDHFFYFDSGDQFQGGLESTISNGSIIMDYLNKINVNKSAIGNHEFDNGINFLKNYTNSSNFEYLSSNVMDKKTGSFVFTPKQNETTIIQVGDIKLGIIGLITKETKTSSTADLSRLTFYGYPEIIKEKSKMLKSQGCNAIIVLAHVGLYCRKEPEEERLKYKLRNKKNELYDCNEEQEGYPLLQSLDSDTVDLFLGGHKHNVGHNWINDIPFVSNDRNGKFADIVYLPFKRTTHEFLKDSLILEGPLPICEKVFTGNKRCDMTIPDEESEKKFGETVNYKFHGVKIESHEDIKKVGEKYKEKFDEYDKQFLTKALNHFESDTEKENALGNLYTDFMRHISGAEIAIFNPGSFRVPLYMGDINNSTIYALNPFSNSFVTFLATGLEIKKIVRQVQPGRRGFYPVSGLKLSLKKNPRKLLTIKRYEGGIESKLEDNKEYKVVSSSFCFPLNPNSYGGDDFFAVTHWFKPKNIKLVTLNGDSNQRDLFMNYLRHIPLLEAKKYYDPENPRMRIVE